MRIFVSGSLAFDRIMTFPGKFGDHILPDKIHILNVCFVVNGLTERFGGTAGNIAYSLALLGEKPLILSSAGHDFAAYAARLRNLGLSLDAVRRVEEEFTAGAYITTDMADNQITGFNPGAMKEKAGYAVDPGPEGPAQCLAIVSPGNLADMLDYPAEYRAKGVPYIFDPGQNITALPGERMLDAITGAMALATNDYELELIQKATGATKAELMERCGALVTTLGDQGSLVSAKGAETRVPASKARKVADPTGAGDAFRAGLLKGLALGRDLPGAARLGSTCAAYCVEQTGTQEHAFTPGEFWARHLENFPGDS
jgi:adenosine kinase